VKVETYPLILGVIVALLGIGIIFDAWTPDVKSAPQERRRRPRIERHRNGEALIGLGVLALAAAFIGRDSWRYSVLVVIIGAVFLLIGTVLNAGYVRELFVNRGPLRRREVVQDVGMPIEASAPMPGEPAMPADAPAVAGADATWDGIERRETPRDARNRKPKRDPSSEDTPRQ
jgi:hypothetical protein